MADARLSSRLTFGRTLVVVLTYPLFVLAFGLITLACVLDRLLPLPLPFPRNPEALAKRQAWCVARLQRAGALPSDAEVTRYEVRQFKQGEAFRSAIAVVTIEYRHGGGVSTFSCIAKFAAQAGSIGTQVISIIQRNGKNEVDFYRTYGGRGALRTYYAKTAGLAGQLCVMVERIDPVHEIHEEAGAPIGPARIVATMLAEFHAQHWRDDASKLPAVPFKVPGSSIDFMCSLAFGKKRKVLRHLARASWHYGNRAQTIVHGDARIGNVLFRGEIVGIPSISSDARAAAGGEPTSMPRASGAANGGSGVLIDFQATRWGLGVYDLAYFMTLSLAPDVRAAHEQELLACYHDALVAAGVRDYDLAALHEDYLHCLVLVGSLLVVPLLGGEVTVDEQNRQRVISGGLVWHERLTHMLATFDTTWLESRYGISAETLHETVRWTSLHPPLLNRGAVLVARELARRS